MSNKYNHNLESVSMNFVSKSGSRNRIRVPVAGTRFNGIKPGDKVYVTGSKHQVMISKANKPIHKSIPIYTVEKDGAIRIPAHRFSLPVVGVKLACDTLTKAILVR